jgi:hypothetical protein
VRAWQIWLLLVLAVVPATGCGMFRSVEQWKCDRLGLCWFGIRPSNMNCAPPPQYATPVESYPTTIPQQPSGF